MTGPALFAMAVVLAAAPEQKIDTARNGTYPSGKWKYVYTIRAKGTRSEGRRGVLTHAGRAVEDLLKAQAFDRLRTPWGLMQFFGAKPRRFGGSGWLTKQAYDRPLLPGRGRLLPAPSEPGGKDDLQPVRLTEADNGRTIPVRQGQRIIVHLRGNPTTGFGWVLAGIVGQAVRMTEKPRYVPKAVPKGIVGSGGVFLVTLEAAKPGRATVRLEYKRSWEKNKKPAKTFVATFVVRPGAPVGEQGVAGVVRKLTGNHMPSVGGGRRGGSKPLSVPVHVFRGQLKVFRAPNPKHPALVRVVRSDEAGRYRVALPPGEYTIVAEIEGKLYLNLFRGDGTWATVRVRKGHWTTWNIDDTSGAAF